MSIPNTNIAPDILSLNVDSHYSEHFDLIKLKSSDLSELDSKLLLEFSKEDIIKLEMYLKA